MWPRFPELLTTYLCHEFAGPIGALSNGTDMLHNVSSDLHMQAIELMHMSAEDAVARLQYYRLAFGSITLQEPADAGSLRSIAAAYLARRHTLIHTWIQPTEPITGLQGKLLLLVLGIFFRWMKVGGKLDVSFPNNACWCVEGIATQWGINQTHLSLLRGASAPLDIDNLFPTYVAELIRTHGGTLHIETNKEKVLIHYV